MKLPFQTLAVLLFFVSAPFGLMQLTTQSIDTPQTYPLMSTTAGPGFAFCRAVGGSLNTAIATQKAAFRTISESVRHSNAVGRLTHWHDDRLRESGQWFTTIDNPELFNVKPQTALGRSVGPAPDARADDGRRSCDGEQLGPVATNTLCITGLSQETAT